MFDTRLGKKILHNKYLRGDETELCQRLVLQSKQLMYVSHLNLEVGHQIESHQFSPSYLMERYFLAGIENRIMDQILSSRFSRYQSPYKTLISNNFKHLLSLNYFRLSTRFFSNLFEWVSFFSYFVFAPIYMQISKTKSHRL